MKLSYLNIFQFILLTFSLACSAQIESNTVCRIEDGRLVFNIDLRWSDVRKKEIAKQYDLDSTIYKKIEQGITEFIIQEEKWSVKQINSNIFELSKDLNSRKKTSLNKIKLLFLDNKINNTNKKKVIQEAVSIGVNNFQTPQTVVYMNENATFYLPEFHEATKVILSGSFNDWSTAKVPMQKTDTGWITTIKLKPGKYLYKYIVDGKWIIDPKNKIIENDGSFNFNSVFYCHNHKFELKGYSNAKKVYLAGSFNNWRNNELLMIKKEDDWILNVYLNDGTYAYKFVVDGQWITDPANPKERPDGSGNMNSLVGIGTEYVFNLKEFLDAKKVVLSGNFNGWNKEELYMEKTQSGWRLPYHLPQGNYEYKYIVDGIWMLDPENENTVGYGETENSFLIIKPNYTFTLNKYLNAKKVIVTGSFNNWQQNSFRMKNESGKWIFSIYLKPGKYSYKFIVDNKWILDPDNNLWEPNEYGTDNSVLWIEPMN